MVPQRTCTTNTHHYPAPPPKPNPYQQSSQISLFTSQVPQKSLVSSLSTQLISENRKTDPSMTNPLPTTTGSDISSTGIKGSTSTISNKIPKLIPGLDPLQSCYGSKSRASQLIREEAPLPGPGILSRPSSPVASPGKKKRVTFNFEQRPSSSSYSPPSCTPPPSSSTCVIPAPVRSSNTSNGRPMRPSLSEQLSAIAERQGK